jgi:hypothetical protein
VGCPLTKNRFSDSLPGYSGSVGSLNSTDNLIPCEAGITGLYLGYRKRKGKDDGRRRFFLATAAAALLLGGTGFCELSGAAGIRVIRAQGTLKVFDGGPGGGSGFIGLTLGHEDTGEEELSAA